MLIEMCYCTVGVAALLILCATIECLHVRDELRLIVQGTSS